MSRNQSEPLQLRLALEITAAQQLCGGLAAVCGNEVEYLPGLDNPLELASSRLRQEASGSRSCSQSETERKEY